MDDGKKKDDEPMVEVDGTTYPARRGFFQAAKEESQLSPATLKKLDNARSKYETGLPQAKRKASYP
jgi:predicted NAD-dependent protein-ADP-ribosyltransferase YbiA (DUF1768 family)